MESRKGRSDGVIRNSIPREVIRWNSLADNNAEHETHLPPIPWLVHSIAYLSSCLLAQYMRYSARSTEVKAGLHLINNLPLC